MQNAGRDAPQERGGDGGASARAHHDDRRIELIGAADDLGEDGAVAADRPRLGIEAGGHGEPCAVGCDLLGGLARCGVDGGDCLLTTPPGSATSALGAACQSVDQTVTTTAGPGWSNPPACSIAARA